MIQLAYEFCVCIGTLTCVDDTTKHSVLFVALLFKRQTTQYNVLEDKMK